MSTPPAKIFRFLIAAATCLVLSTGALHAQEDRLRSDLREMLATTLRDAHLASLTIQVRRDGSVLFSESAGYADLEQAVPASPNAYYPIGSISKSMTAYCVLTLVSQGKLHLTDRLADLLPDYRGAGREATLQNLLTHTSGIADYAGNSAPDRVVDPARHYDERDVVELFAHEPPSFAPGARWQYSNSAYYLLGLIIERVTARPYVDVVQDLLFAPLGLNPPTIADLPVKPTEGKRYAGTYCLRHFMQGDGKFTISYDGRSLEAHTQWPTVRNDHVRLRNQGSGRFVAADDDELSLELKEQGPSRITVRLNTIVVGTWTGERCAG